MDDDLAGHCVSVAPTDLELEDIELRWENAREGPGQRAYEPGMELPAPPAFADGLTPVAFGTDPSLGREKPVEPENPYDDTGA
jgi:hypothetical protein